MATRDVAAGKLSSHKLDDLFAIVSLIAIQCVLYVPFVRSLGFYWDDWPVVWTYYTLGPAGPAAYFSGDRPVMGWIYAHLFPLLGIQPVGWQVLAIIVQCASLVAVFVAFRALWPERKDVAWLVAVLMLLYPGFTQQPIALTYLQHFLSFLFFAVSLVSTIYAATTPRYRWGLLAISLLSESAAYVITEYFLGLEIFRLLVLWCLARRSHAASGWKETSKTALVAWSPYAALWAVYVIWRSFIFHAVNSPQYKAIGPRLQEIKSHPIHEMWARSLATVHNILVATVFAWTRPFNPDLISGGRHLLLLEGGIAFVVTVIGISIFRRISTRAVESDDRPGSFSRDGLVLAFGGLVAAEFPLLISNLKADFSATPSYDDRLTIPFMLASCLMLVILLGRTRRAKVLWLAGILCSFTFFQVQNQNYYRHDWSLQRSIFWQVAWRAPFMAKGTSVFADGLPKSLFRNHTAGMLDLLYGGGPGDGHLNYFIFDLDRPPFEDTIQASFKPGEPTSGALRFHKFHGSTSQSVVWWISSNGELRMITQGDSVEALQCSSLCFDLVRLSEPGRVIGDGPPPHGPLLKIFGPEPTRDWLYYYQRAELERQLNHWDAVAALGDEAMRKGYQPIDMSEWFPFIDGYARAGKYQIATSITEQMLKQSPDAEAPLSSLWRKVLDADVHDVAGSDSSLHALGGTLDLDRRPGMPPARFREHNKDQTMWKLAAKGPNP